MWEVENAPNELGKLVNVISSQSVEDAACFPSVAYNAVP